MRLIDADELVKTLSEEAVHILKQAFSDYSTAEARGIVMAIDSVKEAPTIEPVKCGKWVEDICCDEVIICNACGNEAHFDLGIGMYMDFDYCPFCGAKMEG